MSYTHQQFVFDRTRHTALLAEMFIGLVIEDIKACIDVVDEAHVMSVCIEYLSTCSWPKGVIPSSPTGGPENAETLQEKINPQVKFDDAVIALRDALFLSNKRLPSMRNLKKLSEWCLENSLSRGANTPPRRSNRAKREV